MQSVFSWAPKVARKCDSKHWYACDADGRRSFGIRSRDYQIFWDRKIFFSPMVLRWRELRARESSAIMIIVIFIAFIQAIIIFDYSETPTPPPAPYGQLCNTVTSLLRPLLFGLLAKRPYIFVYKKKTSFGRIDCHLLIRPNFFGPLMTILTGFHCIIF